MGAAVVLVGEDDVDGGGPFLLHRAFLIGHHLAHVIGVSQRHVAFALVYRLHLGPVIALRSAGKVGLDAVRPGFGGGLAVRRDHPRQQRNGIDVLARPGADAPQHVGLGQVLVGCDLARLDPLLMGENDPGARRQPVPQAIGMTKLRRHIGFEDGGFAGLKKSGLDQVVQVADVGRQDQIGRA